MKTRVSLKYSVSSCRMEPSAKINNGFPLLTFDLLKKAYGFQLPEGLCTLGLRLVTRRSAHCKQFDLLRDQ